VASLRIISGPTAGQSYVMIGDESVVGRDMFCEIVLPSHSVSRQHARIVREADAYFIEDLNSLNGTYVNGVKIARRTPLRNQDRIHIHETALSFHDGALDAPAPCETPSRDEPSASASAAPTSGMRVLGSLDGTETRLDIDAATKLHAVLDITRRLGRTTAVDDFLPRVLDSLFEVFPQADRGFILLDNVPGGSLTLAAAKLRRGEADGSLTLGPISRSVAQRVIEQGEAVLSVSAGAKSSALDDLDSLSQISAPLIGPSDKPLGILHIESHDPDRAFVNADLDVLVSVAAVAAQAIARASAHEARLQLDRRERELATAREVQLHFLPPKGPEIAGYRFFEYYQAADDVGGDYFGYIPTTDGRLAIAMGDVSGKGISAALLMARLCSDVRFCVATTAGPVEAIERLHRELTGPALVDRFVTFLLLLLDPRVHRLTVVSAGHMPPLLRHGDNGLLEEVGVNEAGPPLGFEHERRYAGAEIQLAPGDVVVMYTDGIRDATNRAGRIFGSRRTIQAVERGDGTPAGIGKSLLDAVKKHCAGGPQADDICVVCFGRDRE
jgi:serine phosphatase RsbU (regulator of sigma subunit)